MNARIHLVSKAFVSSVLVLFSGFACDPVGEPIVLPDLYYSGKILEPDAGYVRLDCDQGAGLPETLAIYCFDDDVKTSDAVMDRTGKHNARIIGTMTRLVRGPACCGLARQFSETNTSSYIEVPDSFDWDLNHGSISFWLRVNACPTQAQGQGLISRASVDSAETGHFSVILLPGCNWSVFLTGDNESIEVRANALLTPGQWSHLNINFGPPAIELYLAGKLVASNAISLGTVGNRNPWVIGADTRQSEPGTAVPPAHFLTGAAIDLLRISSARNRLFPLE